MTSARHSGSCSSSELQDSHSLRQRISPGGNLASIWWLPPPDASKDCRCPKTHSESARFLHVSFLPYDAEYRPLAVFGVCSQQSRVFCRLAKCCWPTHKPETIGSRCWLIRRGSEGTEPKPPMDRTFSPNPVFVRRPVFPQPVRRIELPGVERAGAPTT